ncbi:MAG: hypothetical protein ACI9MR_001517 [Myxococcota bacterium]
MRLSCTSAETSTDVQLSYDDTRCMWLDADTLAANANSLEDFVSAADVFLTSARRGTEHGVDFKVVFAGTGPSFPAW